MFAQKVNTHDTARYDKQSVVTSKVCHFVIDEQTGNRRAKKSLKTKFGDFELRSWRHWWWKFPDVDWRQFHVLRVQKLYGQQIHVRCADNIAALVHHAMVKRARIGSGGSAAARSRCEGRNIWRRIVEHRRQWPTKRYGTSTCKCP